MKINITPMGAWTGEPRAEVIGQTPRGTVVEVCNTFDCAIPQNADGYSPPYPTAAIWLSSDEHADTVRFFEADPHGMYESARVLLILQEAIAHELGRINAMASKGGAA